MSSSAEIIHWQGSLLNPVEYAFANASPKLTLSRWSGARGMAICVYSNQGED